MKPDDNTITITGINTTIDTITMDSNYSYALSSGNATNINTTGYITITGIDEKWASEYNVTFDRIVFEDCMPDVKRIKNMCEHYPALAKAFENFKTIYKMVDQDYKGNYEND